MIATKYHTALGCGLLLVVMSLGQALCKAPFLRIVELNLCRSYYAHSSPGSMPSDEDLTEDRCKAISIQKDLAMINAYNMAVSSILEITMAFPYAALCVRFSRRTILAANVAGAVSTFAYYICICYYHQTFEVKLVLGQSVWRIFGGGDGVLLSVANALIAESLPAAHLSKVLFLLNATRLVVNAVGQVVGARLMQDNLWAPALLGLAMHGLAIPALCLIVDPPDQKQGSRMANGASEEATDPLLAQAGDIAKEHPELPIREQIWASITAAGRRVSVLFLEPTTAMALAIVFLNELGHGVNNIVQQWSSRSFGWTLAHTNYLMAGQRFVAAMTLIGFSWSFHKLQRAGIASTRLDIGLVTVCQWLTLLGMLGAAMSSLSGLEGMRTVVFICSILIYMMGWGMAGALQSSVTRSVPKDRITMLYTGLNVADRMAGIVSGPLFAGLLMSGMQKGGQWTYLPFWVSVGLFIMVSVLTRQITRWLGTGVINEDDETRLAP